MNKDGKNTEASRHTKLDVELRRLKQTGVRGVADRPAHFPLIAQIMQRAVPAWDKNPLDIRRQHAHNFFRAVIAGSKDRQFVAAIAELLAVDYNGTIPSLSVRRQRADQIYSASAAPRQPDTIQRTLERPLIDPFLRERLERPIVVGPSRAVTRDPQHADVGQWEDDLDEALIAFSNQGFVSAETILRPYLNRLAAPDGFEGHERLAARTFKLNADILRDRGSTHGVRSADSEYQKARSIHVLLNDSRHVAQDELMIAVVNEMNGRLALAGADYRRLAEDDRLPETDRARAKLWIGTVLTKSKAGDEAVSAVEAGIRRLDAAGASDAEIATGYQKLALAELFAGHLDAAHLALDTAEQVLPSSSRLRKVRGLVARGHLLLTDRQTRDAGLLCLNEAEVIASAFGLEHQLRTINSLKRDYGLK
jgi:hypothetical protein